MDSSNQTIDLSHNRLQLCHCYGTCRCSSLWGNVTSLDISHAMLSSLPPSPFKLQGLRILRLDHNSFKEVPLVAFKNQKISKSCHVLITLSSHSRIYAQTQNSGCSIFTITQLSNFRTTSGIFH
ncbi:hypothetical protein BD779DRAFT_510462 [Infundibulicybe gibba]|nr:hypothetical protein BD779DRAFT_510462 [Infundibulicybe gibba]